MILARFKNHMVKPPIAGWFPIKFSDRLPFTFMQLTEPYTEEWLKHPTFTRGMYINRALLEFKRD